MNIGKLLLFLMITSVVLVCAVNTCNTAPVIVEKNLFSPDRKPVSDEEAAPEKPGAKVSDVGLPPRSVQLDGVFIRSGVKKALLRVNTRILGESGGRTTDPFPYMTVSEGESIGDYKVFKIEPRSVSLQKDNQLYIISLFMDGKVAPPVTPLPAAPISPEPPASAQSPSGAEAAGQIQQGSPPNNQPQPVPDPNQPDQSPQMTQPPQQLLQQSAVTPAPQQVPQALANPAPAAVPQPPAPSIRQPPSSFKSRRTPAPVMQ
ncbi:hypothetical protein [Desulfoferrobacter suflitae]|uniref:hypothetical protein n=1 Tax=Desulfoferrobacter suflitae TaxID=2865782 RepID=UPI00216414A8|nr:hypothetical protein [Desulfoferrobacter suflitae]MCK8600692.1 hypothetical protein [Desulfoferrobacter suflitae]